ncbi:outer membrane protein transport protein [Massilibacteroides sp.]|uniref:OmpP1/FadL family transporter n=1 Tax=Massilibacteroides sp. TaxID=2034766 RepID=UPI0026328B74|nr:outer membrane protein transport protein [Massilibacteroides sp.]MDD4514353.1 outer membrane protein transport protein [Massilibacteroides sp.]
MKKIVSSIFVLVSFIGVNAFAQGEMDAYKYSQQDLHGTARYSSMAGAFGALGGDISAMTTNPAGLGIYRSSEVVATLNLSSINAKTDWTGSKIDQKKTKFNFDNIAYVGYFPTGNYSGIKGWNVGFAYNRVKNFNRRYRMSGTQLYSVADYIADITNLYAAENSSYTGDNLLHTEDYNPYNSYNPISVIGYNAGLIGSQAPSQTGGFFNEFGDDSGLWPVESADLEVIEKGAIDRYDISFATNISDIVFLGATVALTDVDYSYRSYYTETFGHGDYLNLDNGLSTEGNGYSFNVGAIVRPIDYLRLGVAYNSPTWYKLTDYYSSVAESRIGDTKPWVEETPGGVTDYKLRTNDRWIFSAAGIIGQYGLISVDYELNNYKGMRLSDLDGRDYFDNDFIKEDYKTSGTLRIGAEAKITPQFSIRAGGAWVSSPVQSQVKNGEVEIITSSRTIPHYTVDKGKNYYTVGFGYRFTPRFYADLACVYKEQKEDLYAFSKTIGDDNLPYIDSTPSSLKTNTTRISLTLGYKF